MKNVLPTLSVLIAFLAVFLAGCGGDGTDGGSSGNATSLRNASSAARATYDEGFADDACNYLSEDEVRTIFDIPAEVEVEVLQSRSPCSYRWHAPKPSGQPEIATNPEYTAGISYVLTVTEGEEAARRAFARMRDRSPDERQRNADQRAATRGAASGAPAQALAYEAVQNVGDEAAWESTHGSLAVRAGNLIFRTVASSTYYQGEPGSGEVVTEQHPEQAAEIARTVLE